ncbi:MAG: serine protease [Bacteriovorax sp.]|nr:serine protease [Bacteriovorax sp.]
MKIKTAKLKLLLLMFLIVRVIDTPAVTIVTKAIYGEDNRNDIYTAPPLIQNLGRSVPGQFSKDTLVSKGGMYSIDSSTTLGRRHCSSVRFGNEVLGPKCTGFLVAPNVVATAGHCMTKPEDCSNFYWAFDYKLKSAQDSAYTKIPADNVYTCKRVLAQKFEALEGIDFTLIQLDREVKGRDPLALDFSSESPVGTLLFVLGYPSSTPLKYTDAGTISKSLEKVFYSNLDTFGGNSGSPVFEASTGKVTGIVSMGNGDWVWNSGNTCKVAKLCNEDGSNCVPSITAKIKLMKDDFEKAFIKARE